MPPPMPSPMPSLRDLPGHLIRRMQQIAVSAFVAEMDRAGQDLTPVQFAVLHMLNDRPGIDQVTLAGLIAYDKVTIGGVIARLEARGLLARTVLPTDRRSRTLQITPAGAEVLARVADPVLRAQDGMLAALTPQERQQLMALLHKAIAGGNHLSRAPRRSPDDQAAAGPARVRPGS